MREVQLGEETDRLPNRCSHLTRLQNRGIVEATRDSAFAQTPQDTVTAQWPTWYTASPDKLETGFTAARPLRVSGRAFLLGFKPSPLSSKPSAQAAQASY